MVQIHEVDVAVGDVLYFGGTTVTIIDIENGEVTFRVDDGELHGDGRLNGCNDEIPASLPR
jgi:hypothetical protein